MRGPNIKYCGFFNLCDIRGSLFDIFRNSSDTLWLNVTYRILYFRVIGYMMTKTSLHLPHTPAITHLILFVCGLSVVEGERR